MYERFLTTSEFAAIVRVKPATIRRAYCLEGHYQGLRPRKAANRFLLWPAREVDAFVGLAPPRNDRGDR